MSGEHVDSTEPAEAVEGEVEIEAEASEDASAETVVHDIEVVGHDVEELLARLSDAEGSATSTSATCSASRPTSTTTASASCASRSS